MPIENQTTVIARTREADIQAAVADIKSQIGDEPVSGLLFFATSKMDFSALAELLDAAIEGPSMGCTTAGEICPADGHCEDSVVAMALRHPQIDFRVAMVEDASGFNTERAEQEIAPLLEQADSDVEQFGMVLVDGLSMSEEQVCASLAHVLKDVSFVGGSAGDDLGFKTTAIACNGKAASDAAVVAVVHTTIPFHVFHSHHFDATDNRLVITEAIPSERRVIQVNGEPAAEGYAAAVGLEIDELSPQIFAAHPVLLSIGGNYYVRSIQKVNEDGSLTFFCAIDEGLVLRVAKSNDLPASLDEQIKQVEQSLGGIEAIIGFDCILRRLELISKDQRAEAHQAFSHLPMIGFSTYGEQYNGLHVNQTITGVAIGRAA